MIRVPAFHALATVLLAVAAPSLAQGLAGSALRGHDAKAPIDVDAQRIEVLDAQNQAIFSGDVRVKQASMGLNANRIKVSYTRAGGGDPVIRRLDADGNVRLNTPSETATGNFGIYDVDRRILTMVGGVVLTRSGTVLRGNRLSIDLTSGRSTLDGSGGAATGGRVTGRFAVPQSR